MDSKCFLKGEFSAIPRYIFFEIYTFGARHAAAQRGLANAPVHFLLLRTRGCVRLHPPYTHTLSADCRSSIVLDNVNAHPGRWIFEMGREGAPVHPAGPSHNILPNNLKQARALEVVAHPAGLDVETRRTKAWSRLSSYPSTPSDLPSRDSPRRTSTSRNSSHRSMPTTSSSPCVSNPPRRM